MNTYLCSSVDFRGLIDLCVNADVLLIYIPFAKSIRERLKGGMCVQMQTKEKTEEFLKIAIPAVLESLVSVIIATIDTKMIAVLGKQAISASHGWRCEEMPSRLYLVRLQRASSA